jgi:signal peptidase I
MWTVPVSLAGLALLAGSCLVWTLYRRYAIVDVHGSSMEPTLRHGDRVLVRRVRDGGVRTGDIVVIDRFAPDDQPAAGRPAHRVWVVKRAAAVAGDPVPGSVARAAGVAPGTAVPAGRLAVLGDNPMHSTDSRVWGYLPTDRLLGVVRRRIGAG